MSGSLIRIIIGFALKEGRKEPLKKQDYWVYRPARVLRYSAWFSLIIGIIIIAFSFTQAGQSDYVSLISLSLLFILIGGFIHILCLSITIRREGEVLIQKVIFFNEKKLNLSEITKIEDIVGKENIILYTPKSKMKVSRFLIGFNKLKEDLI